jgi:hypothetical protein
VPKAFTDAMSETVLPASRTIDLPERVSYRVKRALLGPPLVTAQLHEEKLSKKAALGVLSSDNISSAAYSSEEMLLVLLGVFGLSGFHILLPMTAVVIAVLVVMAILYREVVMVYRVRPRVGLPAVSFRAAAAQARDRPGPTEAPDHRTRNRLPLRYSFDVGSAVTSGSSAETSSSTRPRSVTGASARHDVLQPDWPRGYRQHSGL